MEGVDKWYIMYYIFYNHKNIGNIMYRLPDDKMLQFAKIFAEKHHIKGYGDKPYMTHLESVESVMDRFGITDLALHICAYLHDTVEDTSATVQEINGYFGDEISEIIDLISEPNVGNRKERHGYTYPRIASNKKCIKLKLADRISNWESGGKVNMYNKEYPVFRNALHQIDCDTITQTMWNHLDELYNINFEKEQT